MQHVLQLRSALLEVEPRVSRRSSVTSVASPLECAGRRDVGGLPAVAPSSQLRDPWSHISELGKLVTTDQLSVPNDGPFAARRRSGAALGSVSSVTVSNSSEAATAHAEALAVESSPSINRVYIDDHDGTSARTAGAHDGECAVT